MAKKNKIDIDKFIETHSSKFGTKMPSNMNKEEALTREQLLQTQMIMGSLGALIWGKKTITRESQIKTLLGNENNLFNLVKSIKESIESLKSNTTNINLTKDNINKLKRNFTNPIKESIDKLPQNISDKLTDILSKNSKTETESKKIELIVNGDLSNINDTFNSFKEVIQELQDLNVINQNIGTGFESYINLVNTDTSIIDKNIKNNINLLERFFDKLNEFKNVNENVIYLDIKYQSFTDILENIKKDIDLTFSEDLVNTIMNDLNNKFNELDPITINIDKNLADNINDFISLLKIDPENLKQTKLAIDSLEDILDSLKSTISYDPKKINENLHELIKILDNNDVKDKDKGLPAVFTNISEMFGDVKIKEISKDLTGLNSVLQTLITIISIDPKSINLKGLKVLLSISDSNHGLIKKLVKNLQDISEDIKINDDVFGAITTFFESLSSIGDIGFIKRIRIKSNIKYFINFIGEEIPKLIDEIKKSEDKVIKPETVKSIAAIGSIFESLSKIGELSFKDKIRMKINLMYIRKFIISDVAKILSDVIDEFNKVQPDALKSINELQNLFTQLFSLSETSLRKLFKLSINLSILEEIIRTQLIGNESEDVGVLMAIAGLDAKLFNKVLLRLEKLETIFDILLGIISNEDLSLKNTLAFILKLQILNTSVDLISNILNKLKETNGNTINSAIKKTSNLNKIFNNFTDIANNNKTFGIQLNIFLRLGIKNVELIKSIVDAFNTINITKNTEFICNNINLLFKIFEIKSNIVTALLLNKTLKALKNSVELINDIFSSLSEIDENNIKKAKIVISSFNEILSKTAVVLLIAGLVMRYINPAELILFTVTLYAFTLGITKIYGMISKTIKKDTEVSHEVINLILVSGAVLILGGMFMSVIDPVKLILFTVTLGVFIAMTAGAYLLFGKNASATLSYAKEFSQLIMVSAAVLILGGMFMKSNMVVDSMLFGVLLAAFIGGITWIYKWASKDIKTGFSVSKDFSLLIAISAMSLMIGGLFMSNSKRVTNTLLFAVVLAAFIGGVMGIIKWASKDIKKSLSSMLAISALISIAAATLLIGALFVELFPNLLGNILKFGLILTLFIGGITLICVLLNTFKKYIKPGILILGGIVVIIGMAAVAIGLIAVVTQLIEWAGGHTEIWQTVAVMGGLFLGLAVLCGIIGIPMVAGFVGLGIVVIGAMTILLYLMIGAVAAMVAVVKYASDLNNVDDTLSKIGDAIWGFVKLSPAFMALSVASLLMAPGIAATFALCGALSSVAQVIQAWANLRIPIYDDNGKIVGYKTMGTTDTNNAIVNIENILDALFTAVKNIYDKHSDIFNVDWGLNMLTGKNKIQRVISSSLEMGKMLANVAYGVKAWAKLTIPEYGPNGKIKGYKTLDNTAFNTAGEHIKAVLITLGGAIIETYDAGKKLDPGMFDPQGFLGLGKSKFALVVQTFKTMGPMLSSVAKGVKEWSDFKIPIYKGKEIVGYQSLNEGTLTNAAKNIKSVLKCIGEALVEVIKDKPELFSEGVITDGPAIVAANAMKLMGETLNLTATAVASYASGEFPIFDKDGKIINKLIVNEGTIDKAATAINKVLVCIGTALRDVVENNEDLFSDGIISDAPALVAANAVKNMSEALNNTITAITKLSELKFDDLLKALDSNSKEYNVYHKLNDLLKFTVDIYRLFVSDDSSIATTGKVSHWWRSDTVEKMSFAEYLDEHNGDIEDANDALGTFTSMLSKILNKYSDIGKIVNDNKNALKLFEGGNKSYIYRYLRSSMSSIVSMIRLLIAEDKLDLLDEIEDNEKDIIKGIKSITSICSTLLNGILNIKKLIDSLEEFNLTEMNPMIDSFNECIQKLMNIGTQGERAVNSINLSLPFNNAMKLHSQITMYFESLDMILKINERAKEVGEEGFNILKDGILNINGIIKQIDTNKTFAQHVETLKKYIETINGVELDKLNKMQNFVDSMNKLSQNLGNLDNLTDAIANRLSSVLFELVNQLTQADKSISNAHKLQDERKKLIEESVSKIENLMSQHMIVEISQMTDEEKKQQSAQTPGGTINGKPTDTSSPQGTDTTVKSTEEKLGSPDNAQATKEPGSTTNSQGLTMAQFRQYMEQEYIKKIKKEINPDIIG